MGSGLGIETSTWCVQKIYPFADGTLQSGSRFSYKVALGEKWRVCVSLYLFALTGGVLPMLTQPPRTETAEVYVALAKLQGEAC